MDVYDPSKKLCHHCDKILPRRTVYRHMAADEASLSGKRKWGNDVRSPVDRKRQLRCHDSSDDEDIDDFPNTGRQDQASSQQEIENEMDVYDPSKKLCHHCDKILPRRTVYRHMAADEASLSGKRKWGNDVRSPVDRKRQLRCHDSSDDEDIDDFPNTGRQDQASSQQEIENEDEEVMETESRHSDEEIWEDELEEEIRRDIDSVENEQQSVVKNTLKDKAKGMVQWILCSCFYLQTAFKLSNNCVEHILLLIHQIFSVLGKVNLLCESIANCLPLSIYMLRKMVSYERDDFKKFLVCPNCTAVYAYGDIVVHTGERVVVKRCYNKVFGCRVDPSSGNKGKRGKYKCNANLVKEVTLTTGKKCYPLKVFCYKHVINSLENLLGREGFIDKCNAWRHRNPSSDIFCDIFDGDVWREFQTYKGEPFLSVPNNFAVMINVDWFQPFSRRKDISVGVIYLVFLNLPRQLRFKPENIILLGILPALKKEPENLNSFLKPFVDELKIMEKGIDLFPFGHTNPIKCKLLLLCAASDIPAARKLCGFMGHSATHGCSFCKIKFVNKNGERYCGGFNSDLWEMRSREDHIFYSNQAKQSNYITQKKEIEKTTGYKFTALLELSYFQPSLFCVVEPMHNLFLGTAKRIFNFWVENEIITNSDLQKLSNNIQDVNVPSDIGRLPSNISTNHGQFTADEWKNWVLIYSLIVLPEVLPLQHLKVWQTFVLACHHICRPLVRRSNIQIAHRLFLKFCHEVEELYSAAFITPNMHLHGHLKQCIHRYGPIYGFWAFSFERYNGMLADFPTNKRSVEIQIMRKFQEVGFAAGMVPSDIEYRDLFNKLKGESKESVLPSKQLQLAPESCLSDIDSDTWMDLSTVHMKHEGFSLINLDNATKQNLTKMYQYLYGESCAVEDLASVAKKYYSLYYNGQYIASQSGSRSSKSSVILANLANDVTGIDHMSELRPGVIKYFIRHSVEIGSTMKEHVLGVVEWNKKLDIDQHLNILPPATVWSTIKYQNEGPATFIPIQRIVSKCGWTIVKRNTKKYFVVCPLPQNVYL